VALLLPQFLLIFKVIYPFEFDLMSYSGIARFYKLIEKITIGSALLDARLAHLELLAAGSMIQNALLVGEGNGSFLLPFAQRFPNTQITVLDESITMLNIARKRLESAGIDIERIQFRQADVTMELPVQGSYDLMVTLFFFDNFEEATVRRIVWALQCICTPSAQWLLSDFQVPASGWRHFRARVWLKILYTFFRCVAKIPARSLSPSEAILAVTDFKPVARKTCCGDMLYSTLFQRQVSCPK